MEINIRPNLRPTEHSTKTYLDHIPTLDNTIEYEIFFQEYLLQNQACIIKDVATGWFSTKMWILEDNILNYKYLYKKYGPTNVMIYNCKERHYNSQKTSDMKFDQYLIYWESYIESKYANEFPLLYLKDWNLKKEFPKENFYEVPVFFSSDWLNEYLVETEKGDYRFVYMGPKGTWTPFHADVFKSFSWSVNIYGRKRWILFPPGEEASLTDPLNNLPYDIEDIKNKAKYYEVFQETGDAIFVPTGWHHQVWNIEDTISINHNWINGCNIKSVWFELIRNIKLVKKEISDCSDSDDFIDQTQLILKETFGFDVIGFYEFIKFIAMKRLSQLDETGNLILVDNLFVGRNHFYFDLNCIVDVLKLFIVDEDVIYLFNLYEGLKPAQLLEDIESKVVCSLLIFFNAVQKVQRVYIFIILIHK